MYKILVIGVLFIFSNTALCLSSNEVKNWQDDLKFYKQQLKSNHIDLFHTLDESSFNDFVDKLITNLPTMNEYQVMVELMRLTHSINDGHTSFPLWGRATRNYPFQIRIIDGKVLVVGVTDNYTQLLGSQLHSVNSVPVSTIIDSLSQLSPFSENQYSTNIRAADYLAISEVLVGLGIVEDFKPTTFGFSKDKTKLNIELEPKRGTKLNSFLSFRDKSKISVKESIDENIWLGSLDEGGATYIQFRRYPDYRSMERFSRKVLKYINENKAENLIIDLRGNYGGDFFVGLVLAQQLVLADTLNWRSGVYVLIDNQTFSAAMSNASQYRQILNAQLVGQPSGAKPVGYQDMGQFSLPHSSLVVTYSKRLYRFSEKEQEALFPDILIPVTQDDYLNSRDRVLEWVVSDINSREKVKPSHDKAL